MLRKMLLSCAIASVVSLSLGTPAAAQGPTNQITYFTFSAPFELPGGKVLPAGKYTFKIADSPSNRHIVHILSEDGREMLTTILAIPAERQDPPEEPEVRFMETAANQPPAVKTWWYPGRTIGHEFIYPREQARRLAARQTEPVLTVDTDATTTEEMQTADLSRVDAQGAQTAEQTRTGETRTAEVRTTEPAPVTVEREARVEPEPAPAPRVRVDDEPRTELPRTASFLPLIGLIGVASLAGAALLRRRR